MSIFINNILVFHDFFWPSFTPNSSDKRLAVDLNQPDFENRLISYKTMQLDIYFGLGFALNNVIFFWHHHTTIYKCYKDFAPLYLLKRFLTNSFSG